MNKVILIGNLTRDPEISTTANGISMCRFSIAVSRRFKNAEGEAETDFFNIIAWRAVADNCGKFLKKGTKVAVVGSIQNRSYDAEDGTKRYVTDIVADEVEFLTPKSASSDEVVKKETISDLQPIDDDSLPF
ncbi:MAG: single-stranded DNA-binding protein [Christensenellales bacterium]